LKAKPVANHADAHQFGVFDDQALVTQNSRFHSSKIGTSVWEKPPVWRNGRRTGLKIRFLAFSEGSFEFQ